MIEDFAGKSCWESILGVDSSSFADMVVRFSKDEGFTDGFTMTQDSPRFGKPDNGRSFKHAISF